jgi:pimeloyl-ACP methyl ester carboxylesterase
VVAGHSMGGMAVQTFAVRHHDVLAERVAAIVLVSTAFEQVVRGRALPRAAMWAVTAPLPQRLVSSRGAGPFLVRGSVGRKAVWSHLVAVQESYAATPPEVRGGFLTALAGLDLRAELGRIDVPTTVVSGTFDSLTPHTQSRQLAELIPGATLEIVPGAGHQLLFEAPDRVAAILAAAVSTNAERP